MILLTPFDLGLAATLLIAMSVLTWWTHIRLEKQIIIAALRAVTQLLLLGFVLRFLFSRINLLWITGIALIMLVAGSREVLVRQKRRFKGWWSFSIGAGSLFVSSFVVTTLSLVIIINAQPWYTPQYAIPLLGMLLGNTMNGISVSMDRLTQTVWQQRSVIEQRLLLGYSSREAIREIQQESARSGMIPIINSMATAGIVSLPGMMTGQILAGSPPVEAVKYQILIMFLIASGTGFGIMVALWISTRRLFDNRHRLRLDHLKYQE